jgi:hypothetical protein
LAVVAAEDFGGASVDEVISRLLEEHWERAALAAVEASRRDPVGWRDYLEASDHDDAQAAPIADPWEGVQPPSGHIPPPRQLSEDARR